MKLKSTVLAALAMASCAQPLEAPKAVAGVENLTAPFVVGVGDSVTLTSKDSSDPQQKSLAFRWILTPPVGSLAAFVDPTAPGPSFQTDIAGEYKVSLMVSNGIKVSALPSSLSITAEEGRCPAQAPTIANMRATPSASVTSGDVVQVTADVTDADTTTSACPLGVDQFIASLVWTMLELPAGSEAFLNDSGARNPSFTADKAGTYRLELFALDSTGRFSTAEISVTASTCGDAAPVIVSVDPSPAVPGKGTVVTLRATVTDADTQGPCNKTESHVYSWSLTQIPAGSTARLNDATVRAPSFTVDLPSATYEARLVVTDTRGHQSAPVSRSISSNACGSNAPTSAPLLGSVGPHVGGNVILVAGPTQDADTESCGLVESYTHDWEFVSTPANSTAVFSAMIAARTSFVPDFPGNYVVRMRTTDRFGNRTATTPTLSISVSSCGSQDPIAAATASVPSPYIGQWVDLIGDTSFDPDILCNPFEALSFRWEVLTRPGGSTARITNPLVADTTFRPDARSTGNDDFVLRLWAMDTSGHSDFQDVQLDVQNCGAATPTVPTAAAMAPTFGQTSTVQLTGVGADADIAGCNSAETLRYAWTIQTRTPAANNNPTFHPSADVPNPLFVLDPTVSSPESYALRLTVTDSTGRSSPASAGNVTVAINCGRSTPSITGTVVSASSINRNQTATFSAAVSDADTSCGDSLAYSWSIVPGGAGSPRLAGADTATPTFIPDSNALGAYQLRVFVTDVTGRVSNTVTSGSVTVGTCGTNTPTVSSITPSASTLDRNDTITFFSNASDIDTACGDALFYAWTVAGPGAPQLLGADSPSPTFVPDPAFGGSYTVSVRVTDSTGRTVGPFTSANFTVTDCGVRSPTLTTVTASATTLDRNDTITFTSNAADLDASCGDTLTYAWAIASGAGAPRLLGASTPSPTFVPDPANGGNYTVSLRVTDVTGRTVGPVASATFAVSSCGAASPTLTTVTPSALTLDRNDTITLTSNAADADVACGDTLTYAWTVSGLGTLAGANTPSPTFLPDPAGSGTFTASLRVTDSTGRTVGPVASASITLTTCGATPPTLTTVTTSAASINRNQTITLGSNAADADVTCGDTLSYAWSIASGTGGSLIGANAPSPTFIPDATNSGAYTVSLRVTDSTGRTAAPVTSSSFTVVNCGATQPVVASITPSTTSLNRAQTATFAAAITDADTSCGDGHSYVWSLAPGGAGAPILTSVTTSSPTFIPDSASAGNYQVRLYVVDSTGRVSNTLTSGNINVVACGLAAPTLTLTPATATLNRTQHAMLAATPTDADTNCGDSLSFNWSIVPGTAGSPTLFQFGNNAEFSPDQSAPTAGNLIYTVRVFVTDSTGRTSPAATSAITVTTCGANTPTAVIAAKAVAGAEVLSPANYQALAGQTLSLDARVTDPDIAGCGDTVRTEWIYTQRPSGSNSSLDGGEGPFSSISLDVAGLYMVSARVTDDSNRSSLTTLTIDTREPRYRVKSATTEYGGMINQLELDTAGNAHLAWLEPFNLKNFVYARCSAGSCDNATTAPIFTVSEVTDPVTLVSTESVPYDTIQTNFGEGSPLSMVIVNEIASVFFTTYTSTACTIKYSYRRSSGVWQDPVTVFNDPTCSTSGQHSGAFLAAGVVGTGANARPALAFTGIAATNRKLYYTVCDASLPGTCANTAGTGTPSFPGSPTEIDTGSAAEYFTYPSFALRGGTTPALSYFRTTGGAADLRYTTCPTSDACTETAALTSFAAETPVSLGHSGAFSSLVFDGQNPRIALQESATASLGLVVCETNCATSNAGWRVIRPLGQAIYSGFWNTVALDSSSNILVAHYNQAAGGFLELDVFERNTHYAQRLAVDFSSAGIGTWPALAVTAAGKPRLLYLDVAQVKNKYYPLP